MFCQRLSRSQKMYKFNTIADFVESRNAVVPIDVLDAQDPFRPITAPVSGKQDQTMTLQGSLDHAEFNLWY
jgi:hypothetical protein